MQGSVLSYRCLTENKLFVVQIFDRQYQGACICVTVAVAIETSLNVKAPQLYAQVIQLKCTFLLKLTAGYSYS